MIYDKTQSSAAEPSGRLRRWISRGTGITLALALGVWISAQLWPHWLEFRDRQPPKPDAAPLTQPAYVPPPAPDKQVSTLGTDASLSDKPLQLILVATAPASRLIDATATLGTDPRNPQTYTGGAVLSNGARIVDVQADRIVLSLRGKRETLMMDRDAASRVAMNSVINDQRSAKGYEILQPTFTEGVAGSATSVGGKSHQADLPGLTTSREDLSEFLRPQPVYENDKFVGLKIFPGTNPSRLAALGVEPGDVIRSVDGKLIESTAAWQQIDDALSAGATIVVGVERNGSLMSVSLDGTRLAGDQPTT